MLGTTHIKNNDNNNTASILLTSDDQDQHFNDKVLSTISNNVPEPFLSYLVKLTNKQNPNAEYFTALHRIADRCLKNDCHHTHYHDEADTAIYIAEIFSLEVAEQLSARYPGALHSLVHHFGIESLVDQEKQYSSFLSRIYNACAQPQTRFSSLNLFELEQDPERLTQMYERYGNRAACVIQIFQNTWIKAEKKFRPYLKRICASDKLAYLFVTDFPVKIFKKNPELITQLVEKFGQASFTLAKKYQNSLLTASKIHLSEWEKIYEASEASPHAFYCLPSSPITNSKIKLTSYLYVIYGEATFSLQGFLGQRAKHKAKLYEPFLKRIIASVSEDQRQTLFEHIKFKHLKSNPEKLAQLFENYGDHTPSLLRFLEKQVSWYKIKTADIYKVEDRFHTVLIALKESDPCKSYLETIKRPMYPTDSWVFDTLDPIIFERDLYKVKEVISLAEPTAATVFQYMGDEKHPSEFDYYLKFTRRYGALSGQVLDFCGYQNTSETEQRNRSYLQSIINNLRELEIPDNDIGSVIESIPPYLLEEHFDIINQLSKLCVNKKDLVSVKHFCQLVKYLGNNPIIIDKAADSLLTIAKITGGLTDRTIRSISFEVFENDPDLIYDLACTMSSVPNSLWEVFKLLPIDAALSQRSAVLRIVQEYKEYSPALFYNFGNDVVQEVQQRTYSINLAIERMYEGAKTFLCTVKPDSWSAPWLQQSITNFGTATGKVLGNQTVRTKLKNLNLRELAHLNKERFGIVNLQRYLTHEHGEALLQENIKNLDPEYLPERPIILFANSTDDHNDVLEHFLCDNLIQLAKYCRLFVVEVPTPDDLAVQTIQAASIFGVNPTLKPIKPLHALFINSHSNNALASLAVKSVPIFRDTAYLEPLPYNGELDTNDTELLCELGQTIEVDGYLGFLGCNPAERLEGTDSLVDIVATKLPHLNVVGLEKIMYSGTGTNPFKIELSDNGRIDPEQSHINGNTFKQLTHRFSLEQE